MSEMQCWMTRHWQWSNLGFSGWGSGYLWRQVFLSHELVPLLTSVEWSSDCGDLELLAVMSISSHNNQSFWLESWLNIWVFFLPSMQTSWDIMGTLLNRYFGIILWKLLAFERLLNHSSSFYVLGLVLVLVFILWRFHPFGFHFWKGFLVSLKNKIEILAVGVSSLEKGSTGNLHFLSPRTFTGRGLFLWLSLSLFWLW